MSQASAAALALEQVEERAAEDDRVARRGREGGRPPSRKAADHRGAEERRPGRRSTARRPRSARPSAGSGRSAAAPRAAAGGVVGGDDELGVEALGGAAQRALRVLAGRAAVHVRVVEHVQLGRHRPAGEVAAPRRRRRQAGGGEEGVRGGEPGRGGVDDDGDLAGRVVEAVLEPQPQVLERVERALRAVLSSASCRAAKLSESVSTQAIPSSLVHAPRASGARYRYLRSVSRARRDVVVGENNEPPRIATARTPRAPPPCPRLGQTSGASRPVRRFPPGHRRTAEGVLRGARIHISVGVDRLDFEDVPSVADVFKGLRRVTPAEPPTVPLAFEGRVGFRRSEPERRRLVV